MTFAGMSPGHPDSVCTLPQCGQNKLGAHATGTRDTDDSDVWRIFHSIDTRQICSSVAAPVAQKTKYLRFPI